MALGNSQWEYNMICSVNINLKCVVYIHSYPQHSFKFNKLSKRDRDTVLIMKSYSYLSRLPSNLVGVRKGTILIQNFIMLENLKKSPGLDNDMDSEMAN